MDKLEPICADRRQFLGASAIGTAALALPVPAFAMPITEWDAKKVIYDAMNTKYQAFMDAIYMPHFNRWQADGTPIPAAIDAEADRVGDPTIDLEDELMWMPAPHRAALRWKLDKVFDPHGNQASGWSNDYVRQTVADYRRLLGDA